MLELEGVNTYYGNIQALKDISLNVQEGEIVTLIGANGAGKTTTLRTISGLQVPGGGKIIFKGKSLKGMAPHSIVSVGIGHAPEGRRVFPRLTLMENLEMGAYRRKDKKEIKKDLAMVMDLFPHLKGREKQAAGTLSGGEQQMLAIARALMGRPGLLLLDEPSMGLAPLIVKEIFLIIQKINSQGTTILLVEQNANVALSIADRGYVMETGRIVLSDTAGNLLQEEGVKKAYLGE